MCSTNVGMLDIHDANAPDATNIDIDKLTKTDSGSDDLPIALYMDQAKFLNLEEEHIMRFVLSPDGTVEVCEGTMRNDDCAEGVWTQHGSADNEYDIVIEHFVDIHATVLPDGVAEFRFEGILIEGEWER